MVREATMMLGFLIVGTGRCGTTWAADTLLAGGLQVGHQRFKHRHVLNGTVPSWDGYDGEVSYEAVPALHRISAMRRVLLVRHPVDVVRSWLGLGVFTDGMFDTHRDLVEVLSRRFADVLTPDDPIDRAATFWEVWNRHALHRVEVVARIEDLDGDGLARCIGRPDLDLPDLPPRNRRNGEKGPVPDVTWDRLSEATRVLADWLGYGP